MKQDTVVQVDISGAYYNRVMDLMARIFEKQPDMKQALININTPEKELNLSEAVLQTFMMLMKSVEDAANLDPEKHTETVEIEAESTEDPS